jgi:hypothetical protein
MGSQNSEQEDELDLKECERLLAECKESMSKILVWELLFAVSLGTS